MKLEETEEIIKNEVEGSDGSYPKNITPAAKEIYKLHLEEKLYILEHFRTTLISEGCPELADEYFEQVEELTKELENLNES